MRHVQYTNLEADMQPYQRWRMAVTLKQLRKCFEAKKTFRTRHASLRATRATPNLAEEMQSHLALDQPAEQRAS